MISHFVKICQKSLYFKIIPLKTKIIKLQKDYENKKIKYKYKLNYKYEIFWSMVEEKYDKKINLVKRNQNNKNKKYNIIYSDFANVLGFLPSLLTLLVFDKEIKNLIKYDNLFNNLQKSGDFDHISSEQKIIPLRGLSKSKTLHCKENGYYSIFESDRYGLNNPDDEWESDEIEFFLVGDSFTMGECVNRPYDFGSVLRKLSKRRRFNFNS